MKEDTMSGNKTATEHEWQTQRDKVLQSWLAARTLLATAKESEMELRKQVQQLLFPNPVKGTQRYDLGGGYSIKLVHKINYTLGNKDLTDKKSGNKIKVQDQVEQVMNAIEKCGNEGPFLVDRLIKTSYDLSISEYGKLDDGSQIKKIIDSILITSDAAPAVEFETPEKKQMEPEQEGDGPFDCIRCAARTWNDCDICDNCLEEAYSKAFEEDDD